MRGSGSPLGASATVPKDKFGAGKFCWQCVMSDDEAKGGSKGDPDYFK